MSELKTSLDMKTSGFEQACNVSLILRKNWVNYNGVTTQLFLGCFVVVVIIVLVVLIFVAVQIRIGEAS